MIRFLPFSIQKNIIPIINFTYKIQFGGHRSFKYLKVQDLHSTILNQRILKRNMYTSANIRLTEKENQICNLLINTVKYISDNHPDLPPVCLRVAGGWVRDKLLGLSSDDMDIAIDTMKGEQFALHLKSFMTSQGLHMGSIGTIQVNPEKSKHLETATAKVLDHDLDFVHLRTEVYEDHSRNPIVEFGTPLEDALRRDITINALFYNLHTKQVEDFTEKGLEDLAKGIIRTPLPPRQTFLDDPLRVLRVVRFATRLGYTIDPDTFEAMGADEIDDAVRRKVSKERVGVEMEKMAQGKDPVQAIKLLCDTNLYHIVFEPPKETDLQLSIETLKSSAWHYCDILHRALSMASSRIKWISFEDKPDDEFWKYCVLASWVAPFQGMAYLEKTRTVPVSRYIICKSLKLSNLEGDYVSALLNHAQTISSFAQDISHDTNSVSRVKLGLLIRDLGSRPIEGRWDLAVLVSLVIDLCKLARRCSNGKLTTWTGDDQMTHEMIDAYGALINRVRELSLETAHQVKPLLDGKEISQLLKEKPGKKIGIYLSKVLEWQLEFPSGTKEECIQWLKTEHSRSLTTTE